MRRNKVNGSTERWCLHARTKTEGPAHDGIDIDTTRTSSYRDDSTDPC